MAAKAIAKRPPSTRKRMNLMMVPMTPNVWPCGCHPPVVGVMEHCIGAPPARGLPADTLVPMCLHVASLRP